MCYNNLFSILNGYGAHFWSAINTCRECISIKRTLAQLNWPGMTLALLIWSVKDPNILPSEILDRRLLPSCLKLQLIYKWRTSTSVVIVGNPKGSIKILYPLWVGGKVCQIIEHSFLAEKLMSEKITLKTTSLEVGIHFCEKQLCEYILARWHNSLGVFDLVCYFPH